MLLLCKLILMTILSGVGLSSFSLPASPLSADSPLQPFFVVMYVAKHGWEEGLSPAELLFLLRLIKCESNFNPEAVNLNNKDGTRDYGLVQVNSFWYIQKGLITKEEALNPVKAIQLLVRRYKEGAIEDWVCAKKVRQ